MPMSFADAATKFSDLSIQIKAAMAEMAIAGAAIVEKEAKDELGTYQSAAGPYAAWAPLAESTLKKKAADTPLYETGVLKESIHTVIEGATAKVGTNIDFARDLEYGTSKIPPRPFIGRAVFVKRQEVLEVQAEILKATLSL